MVANGSSLKNNELVELTVVYAKIEIMPKLVF